MRAVSLLLALCTLPSLLSISCAHIPSSQPFVYAPIPHPSWNGLTITRSPNGPPVPDSVIRSLNVVTWEFNIDMPNPHQSLWFRIWTQWKGQMKQDALWGTALPPSWSPTNPHKKVFVAAYPVGGDWQKAEKMKIAIGVKDTKGECSIGTDLDNILKSRGTTSRGTPIRREDGSFVLAWADDRSSDFVLPPGQHDAALMIRFTTNDGKRPPAVIMKPPSARTESANPLGK